MCIPYCIWNLVYIILNSKHKEREEMLYQKMLNLIIKMFH